MDLSFVLNTISASGRWGCGQDSPHLFFIFRNELHNNQCSWVRHSRAGQLCATERQHYDLKKPPETPEKGDKKHRVTSASCKGRLTRERLAHSLDVRRQRVNLHHQHFIVKCKFLLKSFVASGPIIPTTFINSCHRTICSQYRTGSPADSFI